MPYKRPPDRFTVAARKAGFAARSVFKLEEIDRRVHLFHSGQRVLDLGAAPGSWTQYVANKVGAKGKVVALDVHPLRVAVPPNVTVLQMDVLRVPMEEIAGLGSFDVVLSDMAARTTGIRDTDVASSVELVMRAMDIAERVLVPGGKFVAKIFQGNDFETVRTRMKSLFDDVRVVRPEATRRQSTEVYLVGLGRKRS